jgi:hypothetical protein
MVKLKISAALVSLALTTACYQQVGAEAAQAATAPRPPALSGAGTHDPYAFGTWRGAPVQVLETWNNESTWQEMEGLPSIKNFLSTGEFHQRFPGVMSFAQPMWAAGQSAAVCNSGANDSAMRAVFSNLKNAWGPDAYVRLGWEMNGYWFAQNYAPSDPTGWVKCWQRWYGIIKGVSPGFKLVWNPSWNSNTNGHGAFDVRTVWPGGQYVDFAGPDYYDYKQNPDSTAANGEPMGINKWAAFIASEGKPLAVPEWGLDTPHSGDDPAFITSMANVLHTVAASPSGLQYQSFFNLGTGCTFMIYGNGCNPKSAAAYRQLF